jgi:hypothetical protein
MAFVAAQSTLRPGDPTQARVWIENRAPNEAVPVAVERIDATSNVRLAAIDPQVLIRVSTRQEWEYRSMEVTPGEAAQQLKAVGLQGWEAVGVLQSGSNGPTLLLKRPYR